MAVETLTPTREDPAVQRPTGGWRPFVSVVVAVYNGHDTLAACLDSLVAQDYPKDRYEVIVVDSQSTDGTAALIRRYPVRYLFEGALRGAGPARNTGLKAVQGEVVAFTDADCAAALDWLSQGVAGFTHEGIGCVAGEIRSMTPQTLAQHYAAARRILSQAAAVTNDYQPVAYTASAFYRKSALDATGGFDPSLRCGEDADLAWRMQEQSGLKVVYCPGAVVYHTHRERVRDLLRQRKHYGYWSVVNYIKHRRFMPPWTLKRTYWELLAFLGKVGRLAWTFARHLMVWDRARPTRLALGIDAVDVLVFLAKKSGQARACWQYRVWHL